MQNDIVSFVGFIIAIAMAVYGIRKVMISDVDIIKSIRDSTAKILEVLLGVFSAIEALVSAIATAGVIPLWLRLGLHGILTSTSIVVGFKVFKNIADVIKFGFDIYTAHRNNKGFLYMVGLYARFVLNVIEAIIYSIGAVAAPIVNLLLLAHAKGQSELLWNVLWYRTNSIWELEQTVLLLLFGVMFHLFCVIVLGLTVFDEIGRELTKEPPKPEVKNIGYQNIKNKMVKSINSFIRAKKRNNPSLVLQEVDEFKFDKFASGSDNFANLLQMEEFMIDMVESEKIFKDNTRDRQERMQAKTIYDQIVESAYSLLSTIP